MNPPPAGYPAEIRMMPLCLRVQTVAAVVTPVTIPVMVDRGLSVGDCGPRVMRRAVGTQHQEPVEPVVDGHDRHDDRTGHNQPTPAGVDVYWNGVGHDDCYEEQGDAPGCVNRLAVVLRKVVSDNCPNCSDQEQSQSGPDGDLNERIVDDGLDACIQGGPEGLTFGGSPIFSKLNHDSQEDDDRYRINENGNVDGFNSHQGPAVDSSTSS